MKMSKLFKKYCADEEILLYRLSEKDKENAKIYYTLKDTEERNSFKLTCLLCGKEARFTFGTKTYIEELLWGCHELGYPVCSKECFEFWKLKDV